MSCTTCILSKGRDEAKQKTKNKAHARFELASLEAILIT